MKKYPGLFICIFLSLAGCNRHEPLAVPPDGGIPEDPVWYILEEGIPVSLDRGTLGSRIETNTVYTPWTTRMRPSGFIPRGEDLLVAINRFGFLRVPEYRTGAPEFEPLFDRSVFGGRTIGSFFTLGRSVCVHVYVNPILGNDNRGTPGENLVLLKSDSSAYSEIPSGKDPEAWEMTEIIPGKDGWSLAWRGMAEGRGLTEYEYRAELGSPGTPISADAFRSAYDVIPVEGGPGLYRDLYGRMKDYFGTSDIVLHITEQDTSPPRAGGTYRLYRGGKLEQLAEGKAVFLSLRAVKDGETRLVLFPEGNVVFTGKRRTGS